MTYLIVILFLICLLLDFISKYLTVSNLPLISTIPYIYPYGGIAVFKDFFGIEFSINHAINLGAAWSLFSDYTLLLTVARILLIGFLFYYVIFLNKDPLLRVPLILILAGAIGNVLDIFIYGHVIDMFHFVLWGYDYPIFNLADTFICVGVVLYLFFSWRSGCAKNT